MVAALFIQRAFEPETQLYFGCVVVTVIISIVLHELAHGWAAIWQGDDTPKMAGHMTADPMVHMGGMSLLMLALVGMAFGAMPVNPRNFRSRFGDALVSAAGPAMNFLLALQHSPPSRFGCALAALLTKALLITANICCASSE